MTSSTQKRSRNPAPPLDHDQCWQAVAARNPSADGRFVYAVRTTGIYCRPSCSARRPNRENVSFHLTGRDAESAGFRPCLKCQPDGSSLNEIHASAVARACRILEQAGNPPPFAALARAVGMSPFHFHRVFSGITGLSPRKYADGLRAARVRQELPQWPTVSEAIIEAGYRSSGRFYAASAEMLGMPPRRFRQRGSAVTIRFATAACSLGTILVASTTAGVCAILLGDRPDELVADLRQRFSAASLVPGGSRYTRVVEQVIRFVDAPHHHIPLPLDIRGTAFQLAVWNALKAVPPGTTTTYSDIAAALGMPSASRAVARACAANPLAIAIPCHRVVRKSGQLAGYRWGITRKRTLLERESRQPPPS